MKLIMEKSQIRNGWISKSVAVFALQITTHRSQLAVALVSLPMHSYDIYLIKLKYYIQID